jgi:ATP-dependent Clp protease adapter protein ClpS
VKFHHNAARYRIAPSLGVDERFETLVGWPPINPVIERDPYRESRERPILKASYVFHSFSRPAKFNIFRFNHNLNMSASVRFLFCLALLLHGAADAFVAPTQNRRSNGAAGAGIWGKSRSCSRQSLRTVAIPIVSRMYRTALAASSGPAILDRPAVEVQRISREQVAEPVKERKGLGDGEAWEVRIYNDGLNTREHVARSLVQVTGLSELQAYQTMMHAHYNGIAVVGRWVYEIAEMFHDALKKKGIVCDLVPVGDE